MFYGIEQFSSHQNSADYQILVAENKVYVFSRAHSFTIFLQENKYK